MRFLVDMIGRTAPPVFDLAARVLPAPILALGGAVTADLLLGLDGSLVGLAGARIRLELTSPQVSLGFVIRGGRLWPAPPTPWTVCIRGDSRAFLALLLQTEDADALFFDRRLAIEGDTEIALQIRHALEGAIYKRKKRLRQIFP